MLQWTVDEGAVALRFCHVGLPDDAIECHPWRRHGVTEWRRRFLTREWEVAGIWISVVGEQNHRGEVTRWMHVGGEDRCTSSDGRQLIAALEAAGQLLDSLVKAEVDPTVALSHRVSPPISG
jgi:hypothetical protein